MKFRDLVLLSFLISTQIAKKFIWRFRYIILPISLIFNYNNIDFTFITMWTSESSKKYPYTPMRHY